MRFVAAYIMRGRMAATTAASTLAILSMLFPPFSIFSAAAVALVTLRKGGYEGGFVLLASTAVMSLLGAALIGNFALAVGYGLLLWVPVLLLALVVRVTGRLGWALGLSTLLGVAFVGGYYLFVDEPAAVWFEIWKRISQPALEALPTDIDRAEALAALENMARYMTGLAAAGATAGMMLGLLLGRWWQALLFNPGGFRSEFLALRMSVRAGYGSLAVAAVGAFGSGALAEAAFNIVVVMAVLYAVLGVAVLHTFCAASNARVFLLTAFYLAIIFMPFVLVPIALIGFGDTWFNWRRKLPAN